MRKKILLTFLLILILSTAGFLIFSGTKGEKVEISSTVERGPFEIMVYSSGQLEAQNSENIVVPDELRDRSIRIYEIKITDLIEEGTVVDSGDYVASLDHKTVEEVLANAQEELETALNNFEDAKMDSNLNLSNQRDLITNAREDLEEKQIILDESVYESPSVIRKAEMDLDKAKRKLAQEIKGYELKKRQSISKVERRKIDLRQKRGRVEKLKNVYHSLKISAPKSGMVIYGKDRMREKIKVGSTVSPWSPIIATLPDLSSMLSITYVNEIDISKVKTGQKVTIGIDALPGRSLEGEVVSVANIGQQMPKSDAKVFEVRIRVFGKITDLKPAMTTSNIIETDLFPDTLFIPSETIFENDSLQFVYLKTGNTIVKKVVDVGDKNENFTLVREGLNKGDEVLLTIPENSEQLPIEGMELYNKIKERRAKEEEEAQKAIKNDKARPFKLNKKSSSGGGSSIIIG
ncbi:MAG: efflux RND transporter periplasmic adaptor subunit [Prolixibacteraceae bacterium]|nr:efflux RND transporter periplasmic adaptor subunit [Prolixibacteraceae bacterium]